MRLIDAMRIDFDEVDISGCTDVDDIIWAVEKLIDAQPTADAIPLPKGRPGDYLEWDIGTGITRFYHISAIHITKDSVRYDIGDMCPVVDHRAILRILTEEEMRKEIVSGNAKPEVGDVRYYGERKDNGC